MKIVFMGTPEFAVESLDRLFHSQHKILAVVTGPDKPAGRGMNLKQSAVKEYCLANNIKCFQPEKLRDEDFIKDLRNLNADAFIVIAFRMLPQVIWEMPKFGTINIHASLLPEYRGAAPINHAIINGEKETGVSSFLIQKEIDTGDILMQKACEIKSNDTAGSLHDKLKLLGADLIVETLNLLEIGSIKKSKQPTSTATHKIAPKLSTENTKIIFNQPAEKVYNFCRGLSPFPGAWCNYKQGNQAIILKVYSVKVVEGTLISNTQLTANGLMVPCLDKNILLTEVQPAGKKRMSGEDFSRGIQVSKGIPQIF
jgi:methionyl-tRNA formyltransferase